MQRPDGSQSIVLGWMMIVAGVFAAVFAALAPDMNWLIIWVALANLGIGLGVLLLSLGYLVRAIWFLPAREFDEGGTELRKCDYCDFKIAAPSQPCSAMRSDQVSEAAERIDSDNCRKVLAEKGILKA